jgi:hypothetical protein
MVFALHCIPWAMMFCAQCTVHYARAAWMFHGRAYAGGRIVFVLRLAVSGTP